VKSKCRYSIIGTVTSRNISSIVFKQGDTIHTISNNLPSVDANDNTWTLDNNDTWTSQLTQGDYKVTVNLSGSSGSVTDSSSTTTTAVDTVKPDQPAFDYVDTGLPDNETVVVIGVLGEILAVIGCCLSNIGYVVSTIISESILLISETLPTASICLICMALSS
jgi:hypothetical protein